MKTYFRSLYTRYEEGVYSESIITYYSYPVLFKKSSDNQGYIAQRRIGLRIDLWIVILKSDWLTKELTKQQ